MNLRINFLSAALIFLLSNCGDDSDEATPGINVFSTSFDFSEAQHDWRGGFADYKAIDSLESKLTFEYVDLPPGVANQKSLMISGDNNDTELFMFIKKKITGFTPDREYTLGFTVDLLSTTNGIPVTHDSILLKAGASVIEPKSIKQNGYYRINIDKGTSYTNGKDMLTIGTISSDKFGNTFSATYPGIKARTNSQGELWLVVGTHLPFPGTTSIYYTKISVVFSTGNY